MKPTPEDCASSLFQSLPLIMQIVRAQMRGNRSPKLSVPQMRTLIFISNAPGAGLSEAAEFIGLSLPSMSKMVEGLVRRGLILREAAEQDRRRVSLSLTELGGQSLVKAKRLAMAAMTHRLSQAGPEQLERIAKGLGELVNVLGGQAESGQGKA